MKNFRFSFLILFLIASVSCFSQNLKNVNSQPTIRPLPGTRIMGLDVTGLAKLLVFGEMKDTIVKNLPTKQRVEEIATYVELNDQARLRDVNSLQLQVNAEVSARNTGDLLRVLKSDTAKMLSPYVHKNGDTTAGGFFVGLRDIDHTEYVDAARPWMGTKYTFSIGIKSNKYTSGGYQKGGYLDVAKDYTNINYVKDTGINTLSLTDNILEYRLMYNNRSSNFFKVDMSNVNYSDISIGSTLGANGGIRFTKNYTNSLNSTQGNLILDIVNYRAFISMGSGLKEILTVNNVKSSLQALQAGVNPSFNFENAVQKTLSVTTVQNGDFVSPTISNIKDGGRYSVKFNAPFSTFISFPPNVYKKDGTAFGTYTVMPEILDFVCIGTDLHCLNK